MNDIHTNLYKILGLSGNANEDDIRKSYKKLVRKYHPDKNDGNDTKFKKIQRAYNILSNPERKKQYDMFGSESSTNNTKNFNKNFNPFDSFSKTFKNASYSSANFSNFNEHFNSSYINPNSYKSNSNNLDNSLDNTDIKIDLILAFDLIYKGGKRQVEYNRNVVCEKCNGIGVSDKKYIKKCKKCNGNGKITKTTCLSPGFTSYQTSTCDNCYGRGKEIESRHICKTCKGFKQIRKREKIIVNIPISVKNGEKQILKSKGNGISGDLVITFSLTLPENIKRINENMILVKDINIYEIIHPKEIIIDHPYFNKIKLKNKKPINLNKLYFVSMLGFPIKNSINSDNYGKLMVKFKLKYNPHINKEILSLLDKVYYDHKKNVKADEYEIKEC